MPLLNVAPLGRWIWLVLWLAGGFVVRGNGTGTGNAVLDWNAVMMRAIRLDNTGPTLSTRNLAILHLAIYDAVNAVTGTHQPYLFQQQPSPDSSAEAAAAAAGYEVSRTLYPGIRADADATFRTWWAGVPDNAAITAGLELGRSAALAILGARAADGSATEVPYIPSNAPGAWRRTPPFFRPPLTPHWRYVKPFAVPDIEAFVPGPPPALESPEYAEALEQVRELGGSTSTVRTAYQRETAVFWSDFSYTAMPPGHWHEIAAAIVRDRGTDLAEAARLMALLSLAQADAAIVCWEAKYRYNLWRPITAIQRADEDGNPATESDSTWNHALAAPPFPAYPSGHSTFSKASAEVLAFFYGTDAITFTAISDSLPEVSRTYESLSACADEVGMSRIYGGIHFSFDNVQGKASGRRVAEHVIANYLLPSTALPFLRIERASDGRVGMRVHGHAGALCVLEASSDLQEWTQLTSRTAASGGIVLEDPMAGQTARFYRVVEQ